MKEIRLSTLAAQIVGWTIVGWIICAIALGSIYYLNIAPEEWLAVLVLPMSFFANYFGLRVTLPRACRKYGLQIQKGGEPVIPKGAALSGMTWGLVWRTAICTSIAQAINNFLGKVMGQENNGVLLILGIFVGLCALYFATIWLLKYPIGSTRICHDGHQASNELATNYSDASPRKVSAIETVKEGTTSVLTTSAMLSYFAIGLIQLGAVVSFFHDYWHWWYIPSILVAAFVAYIPVIGAIAGIFAAIEVWEWRWYWATLLFFFPLVLLVIVTGFAGLVSVFEGVFRRKS